MSENKFIAINDVRIKASNIKNYGVSVETKYLAAVYRIKKVYTPTGSGFFGRLLSTTSLEKEKTDKRVVIDKGEYEWIKNGGEAPIYGLFDEDDDAVYRWNYANVPEGIICHAVYKHFGQFGETTEGEPMIKASPEDVWCEEKKYLYITTYQNDNFKYYEDEVDINKIMTEIDNCLL